VDRPAPAAQNVGVGFLVTAMAHLHVRNFARKFEIIGFVFVSCFYLPHELSAPRS
jgi:hypothetical protein